jgi:hypothetical protein
VVGDGDGFKIGLEMQPESTMPVSITTAMVIILFDSAFEKDKICDMIRDGYWF